ncbi:MAG: hypothetical protein ABSH53_12670 [Holophaga sp.]|jgi:hypothetical protein
MNTDTRTCAAAVLLGALGIHLAAATMGSTRVGILNGSGEEVCISVHKPADVLCGDGNARIWSQLSEETYGWPLTDEVGWPLKLPPRVVPEGSRIVFWMEFQDQPDESFPAVNDNCKLLVRTGSGQHFTLIFTAGAIWTGEGTIEEEATLGVHDPGTWQPGQLDKVLRYFPSCSTTSLVFGAWPPPSWPTGSRGGRTEAKNDPVGSASPSPRNASLSMDSLQASPAALRPIAASASRDSLSAGSMTSESVSPSTSRESLGSDPATPGPLTGSASRESVRSEDGNPADADPSAPARTVLTAPGGLVLLPPAALQAP